jgi:hypothetical protein
MTRMRRLIAAEDFGATATFIGRAFAVYRLRRKRQISPTS